MVRPNPRELRFPSLGPLERRVLEVLWARGPSTVTEVVDVLSQDDAYVYTTISTILVRLTRKRLASRTRHGRAHRYAATVSREKFLAGATGALLQQFSSAYGASAVVHFADAVARLPKRQRDRVRQRLQDLLDN